MNDLLSAIIRRASGPGNKKTGRKIGPDAAGMLGCAGPSACVAAGIFCNDRAFANRLVSVVASLGIDCSVAHPLPTASCREKTASELEDYSLVFLYVRQIDDRTFAAVQHLCAAAKCPVVVIGPIANPHEVLSVLRCGAADFVDAAGDLELELRGVVGRVMARGTGDSGGSVVALVSASGGSGCSVLSANLAAASAKHTACCALFDFALENGTLCTLYNLKRRHTLEDVCQQYDRLDAAMLEQSLLRHASGVRLLAAPSRTADTGCVTAEAISRIMEISRKIYSHIVVDGGEVFQINKASELFNSDVVCLVTRLDFVSLVNARRAIELLLKNRLDAQKVRLVVSRYGQPGEIPRKDAEAALNRKFDYCIPDAPKVVNSSINTGSLAVFDAPRAPVCRAITAMAQNLLRDLQAVK